MCCKSAPALCISIQGQKLDLQNSLYCTRGNLNQGVVLLLPASNREIKYAPERRDHQSNGNLQQILCILVLPAHWGIGHIGIAFRHFNMPTLKITCNKHYRCWTAQFSIDRWLNGINIAFSVVQKLNILVCSKELTVTPMWKNWAWEVPFF